MVHELPDIEADSWDTFKKEVKERTEKGSPKAGNISVMSWRKFNRLLRTRTENDLFTGRNSTKAESRRQKTVQEAVLEIKKGKVLVIDIEPLPNYLQCLVFGDVIQSIWAAKLGDIDGINPADLGTVVVFADELNKYAPKSSGDAKTLTRDLLEITERGRSFGVVLFGAEQFRSGVHERILGNCSTNIFGRTSPVEIARPDYRYFSENHKTAITRLSKGNLLLQHAIFKTSLIKVEFPFPCYYQPKG
jgi:DNA helicase HerA-like ATPase